MPAPILHGNLWPTVGLLVHTITTRGGCNESISNRSISHKEDPPLGWGKQQWPVCQSPYHLHYTAAESSLISITLGIYLTIKTDNGKKILWYTIFIIYTTLLFNKNYIYSWSVGILAYFKCSTWITQVVPNAPSSHCFLCLNLETSPDHPALL